MPRDVSLSDSKCWNGGHEWVERVAIMTRRMTYVCVLRKLSSYFHFTSMFCMRTDLELLKRMFQTACHNSDFITVLKLAKYATVFASFLLSDLVQTLHTFSTHHYLWSFPFFLWISKYFFRKTEVFYVFFFVIFGFRYLPAVSFGWNFTHTFYLS